MLKRMIIMLCVVGVVFAALAWFVSFRAGMIKQAMAVARRSPADGVDDRRAGQRLAIDI